MMLDLVLHKFYAASISVGTDGTMFVTSAGDRIMAWGMIFCFIAALCLISFLMFRKLIARRIALSILAVSLVIPVLIVPSVRHEYIHVSPTQITIDTGAWMYDSETIIYLHGLDNISEEIDGFIPGNFIGDPDVNWRFFWEDGQSRTLELNDFFNAHRMVVAYYFKDRGFIVNRLEDQSADAVF